MERTINERKDEVMDRLGSLGRRLNSMGEKYYYHPTVKGIKRIALRLSILTYGYMLLEQERINAQQAAA